MAKDIAVGEGTQAVRLFGFGLIEQAAQQGIQSRAAVSPKVGGREEVPGNGFGPDASTGA